MLEKQGHHRNFWLSWGLNLDITAYAAVMYSNNFSLTVRHFCESAMRQAKKDLEENYPELYQQFLEVRNNLDMTQKMKEQIEQDKE